MQLLNSFTEIISNLITYDIFIVLGVFAVFCGVLALVDYLVRGC